MPDDPVADDAAGHHVTPAAHMARRLDDAQQALRPGGRAGAVEPEGAAAGARAIHRALAILECFGAGPRELGIHELAKALDLSPSTVHRLVRAMVTRGYLAQSTASNRYVLGPTMIVLGQVTQRAFGLDRVVPLLEEAARRYGEGVALAMRDGAKVVVLAEIESTKLLGLRHPPGSRLPLHASALGKAVLYAARDRDVELRSLGKLAAFTPRTITRRAALAIDLEASASRGYALDDEELAIGVRGVAVPVLAPSGTVVAAIGLMAPAAHLPDPWVRQIGRELGAWAARAASIVSL